MYNNVKEYSHVRAGAHEEESDEEWKDGEHVHNVHPVLEEGPLVGGARQPDEVLQGEPRDADSLDHRQGRVVDSVPHLVLLHNLTISTNFSFVIGLRLHISISSFSRKSV